MNRLLVALAVAIATIALATIGCAQAPPIPASTGAPVAATKAPEPVKVAEPTRAIEPSKAAIAQPTAPVKKVDYPQKSKPITIIIPMAAGGTVDIGARLLAPLMEAELGTIVQVTNKPGATTQVGTTELASAKPDGHTLGFVSIPTTLITYLEPGRKAAYSRKDFQTVAGYTFDSVVVAVKADSRYKSMNDLVDAATASPGKITVATTGLLSVTHLTMLMMQKLGDATFAFTHFDGGAPAVNALLGGHVDAVSSSVGNLRPHVMSGALRAIGIAEKEESGYLPGVKTLESQGYKIYAAAVYGMAAPAGTPREVVDILSGIVKKATQNDGVKKSLGEIGLGIRHTDPDQFAAYWAEMEAWTRPLMELGKQ